MLFVQLFFSLLYFYLSVKIPHSLLRLVVTFISSLMSAQLLVNLGDYNNINHIGTYTVLIFNLNILFLLVGVYYYLYKHKKMLLKNNVKELPDIVNVKLLIAIQIIALIIILNYYFRYAALIALAAYSESSRSVFYESGVFFNSYVESFFYFNVLSNYKFISSFLFSYLFLKSSRSLAEFILMILSFIFIVMNSLVGQGRGDLLLPVFMILILSCILKVINPILFKSRIRQKFLFILSLAFIGISAITILRVGRSLTVDAFLSELYISILPQIVDYFSFPITAFEFAINNIFRDELPLCGMATFAGIYDLICTPLALVDHSIFSMNNYLGARMAIPYNINGQSWNALYTGVLNFYLDFKIFGVIIYPFILGNILAKLSISILHKKDLYSLILYCFFFTTFYRGLFSSPFQSFESWIFLLLIYIIRKVFMNRYTLYPKIRLKF